MVRAELSEALTEHKLATGRAEGYVFGRSATLPFSQNAVTERARRIWTRGGMEACTLHEARHTAVTLYVHAGADWLTISKIAGHSNVQTTMDIYAHLLRDSQRNAGAMLDAFLQRADAQFRLAALD